MSPVRSRLMRRLLVAEGFEEGERELGRVERLLGELGDGFFDLDGVHVVPTPLTRAKVTKRSISR